MTILHLIGQFFLHWLVLSLPATAQTTAQADLPFSQIQQLDQSAVLPFWKESTSLFWTHLSESLEASSAENEEENNEGHAASSEQFLLVAFAHQAAAMKWHAVVLFANVPMYLRYCRLKVDLI